MSNVIKRVAKFKAKLSDVANWLGFTNIDHDEYDDVYHSGYSSKDAETMDNIPSRFEPIKHLILPEIAEAHEQADRLAIVAELDEATRNAIKESLEKIEVVGEYEGLSSEGVEVSVSCPSHVSSVEILLEEGEEFVLIEIVNPEHLINDLINGQGRFYPHEIPVDVASDKEVQGRLHFLGEYFEIYGESKGYMGDRFDGSTKWCEEDFEDCLTGKLFELGVDDWVQKICDYSNDARNDIDCLYAEDLICRGSYPIDRLLNLVKETVEKSGEDKLRRMGLAS